MVTAASGIGAAAPAASGVHVVHAGQSIQKAVDAAAPGDVVRIAPGTFHESVTVTKPLLLVGSGERTVIRPGANAGTTKAKGACAKAGDGLCVTGTGSKRVKDVAVRGLSLIGFKKYGLWATGTDHLTVEGVVSAQNGVWGIAQEKSVRGVFRHNTVADNGDAGLVVANVVDAEGGATDQKGTLVQENRMTGNRIGATLRRVRNLSVDGNIVDGNCAGVFVVGDESKPRAGDMTISHNAIHDNNTFCPKTARLGAIQGAGIVLTGSDGTRIRQNSIHDNAGATSMSGGVVLIKSFVGVTNTGNVVQDNDLSGNKPADLANFDTAGKNNTFAGNHCQASHPTGMC